jgi:hypothetical protein
METAPRGESSAVVYGSRLRSLQRTVAVDCGAAACRAGDPCGRVSGAGIDSTDAVCTRGWLAMRRGRPRHGKGSRTPESGLGSGGNRFACAGNLAVCASGDGRERIGAEGSGCFIRAVCHRCGRTLITGAVRVPVPFERRTSLLLTSLTAGKNHADWASSSGRRTGNCCQAARLVDCGGAGFVPHVPCGVEIRAGEVDGDASRTGKCAGRE